MTWLATSARPSLPAEFRAAVAAAVLDPLMCAAPGDAGRACSGGGATLDGFAAFAAELCTRGVVSATAMEGAVSTLLVAAEVEAKVDMGAGSGRACQISLATSFNAFRPHTS